MSRESTWSIVTIGVILITATIYFLVPEIRDYPETIPVRLEVPSDMVQYIEGRNFLDYDLAGVKTNAIVVEDWEVFREMISTDRDLFVRIGCGSAYRCTVDMLLVGNTSIYFSERYVVEYNQGDRLSYPLSIRYRLDASTFEIQNGEILNEISLDLRSMRDLSQLAVIVCLEVVVLFVFYFISGLLGYMFEMISG